MGDYSVLFKKRTKNISSARRISNGLIAQTSAKPTLGGLGGVPPKKAKNNRCVPS
jgi:hypothetical protein